MKVNQASKKFLFRVFMAAVLTLSATVATAQELFVITDGPAVKYTSATVGSRYLALDVQGGTPRVVVATEFSARCVWKRTASIGYYYQEVGDKRYILYRDGDDRLAIAVQGAGSLLSGATQWYDWTFGVARQEINSGEGYKSYWIVLNEAGDGWELSCDSYGRPGVGNGDSRIADCATYYSDGTTPMVAATYNLVRAEEVEAEVLASSGGQAAATLTAPPSIANGGSFVATVSGIADYSSRSVQAYTRYNVYNITDRATQGGVPEGGNEEDYKSFDGTWYYPIAVAASHYEYGDEMHAAAPAADEALVQRTVVDQRWSIEGAGKAFLSYVVDADNPLSLTVTATRAWAVPGLTATLTFTVTYSDGSQQQLRRTLALSQDPTQIVASATEVSVVRGEDLQIDYTLTPDDAYNHVERVWRLASSANEPTAFAGTDVEPNVYTLTLLAYAYGDEVVACSTSVSVTVRPQAPTAITFSSTNDGQAQVATVTPSANVHLTADGSEPTASSLVWEEGVTELDVADGDWVKAVVVENGIASDVFSVRAAMPTGLTPDQKTVVLNDLEDHNWSYYSDPECPIRSLYPRNFKIVYDGYGRVYNGSGYDSVLSTMPVQVDVEHEASKFVYLETLERCDTVAESSRFAYRAIPNPFSVRPTHGNDNTRWRGFAKWHIKSISGGKVYTAATGGTELVTGGAINADQIVYFEPNNRDRSNANNELSMSLELEADWDQAYLLTTLNNPTSVQLPGATEELNFVVLSSSGSTYDYNNSNNRPMTIMSIYPNGTTSGTGNLDLNRHSYIKSVRATAHTKLENIIFSGGGNYSYEATNKCNLTIGRRCGGSSTSTKQYHAQLYPTKDVAIKSVLRVESGKYENCIGSAGANITVPNASFRWIFGNDYDRATRNNENLSITGEVKLYSTSYYLDIESANDTIMTLVFKSGKHIPSDQETRYRHKERIYLGQFIAGQISKNNGKRIMIMEGGKVKGIAGGQMHKGALPEDGVGVEIWMKGGEVSEMIYGGAEYANAGGGVKIVCTGGDINGWVAGANNAYPNGSYGGSYDGSGWVYVGGRTKLPNTESEFNGANGGNVFGAGCGSGTSTTMHTGSITNSVVVVADEAEITGSVYGGGNVGWATNTARVYVLGGIVAGSVFGGGNQNKDTHGTATVKMTGGTVLGGVYGGSNSKGTVKNATVIVNGGTVGSEDAPASVFGNGYGSNTSVTGNVKVEFGRSTDDRRATVWGGVYGGGENAHYTSNGHTFTVDVEGGDIHQSVYGGGLKGNITGPTDVTVGGNAKVYEHVFGGGDDADILGSNGNTTVKLGSCIIMKNVYGGGNKGKVAGSTDVQVGITTTPPTTSGE